NTTKKNIKQKDNTKKNIKKNNTKNVDEIEKLISGILENLDTYFTEKETKAEIKELIEVIQHENKQEKPKQSMIKTALTGLQTFNESTQFISTIAQLTQMLGFLPPN